MAGAITDLTDEDIRTHWHAPAASVADDDETTDPDDDPADDDPDDDVSDSDDDASDA